MCVCVGGGGGGGGGGGVIMDYMAQRRLCGSGWTMHIKGGTALYDFHVSHVVCMVPFVGWSMPVSINSTLYTRKYIHLSL